MVDLTNQQLRSLLYYALRGFKEPEEWTAIRDAIHDVEDHCRTWTTSARSRVRKGKVYMSSPHNGPVLNGLQKRGLMMRRTDLGCWLLEPGIALAREAVAVMSVARMLNVLGLRGAPPAAAGRA